MTTAKTIARHMATADIATADKPDVLALKVLIDTGNHSGVLSCEWELQTIVNEHGCSDAVALRAMQLYRAAIVRAAKKHLDSISA